MKEPVAKKKEHRLRAPVEAAHAARAVLVVGREGAAAALGAALATRRPGATPIVRLEYGRYRLIEANDHPGILTAVAANGVVDAAICVLDDTTEDAIRGLAAILGQFGVAPLGVVAAGERPVASLFEAHGIAPLFVLPLDSDAASLKAALGELVSAARREAPLRAVIEAASETESGAALTARVVSGRVGVGDRLVLSPSNREAEVVRLHVAGRPAGEADRGELADLDIDQHVVPRPGDLASHMVTLPVETDVFLGQLCWLGATPPAAGASYTLRLHGRELPVSVQSVSESEPAGNLEAVLRVSEMIALDPFEACAATGRFLLYDDGVLVGGGRVSMRGYADQRDLITVRATNVARVEHRVSDDMRAARNGHRGGVLWLTGLSGSGKSTLAIALEKELFSRGYHIHILDGDNVRHGLNANLGFSPEDRAENIRRIGEAAALFAQAGMITVTAFISPYRSDRDRARAALPAGFHEIYVKCSLETCETRDPKGLYKKARAGEIADFTGISAPYEAPERAELVVDTAQFNETECVEQIVSYVLAHFALRTN